MSGTIRAIQADCLPVKGNPARLTALEARVLRHFASAIVIVAAAGCAGAPAAHATQFLTAIDDVPLPNGLTEAPEPMIFESDQGRVVRTSAEGNLGGARVSAFYAETLPALGWKPAETPDGVVYAREDERLTIRVRERANMALTKVEFELVVTLASTRLPD
jgi:hypothetical protein